MENVYQKALKVWRKISPETNDSYLGQMINAQEKFVNFFQPGPTYYFIFNVNKGEFEFLSDEVLNVLGYSPRDFTAFQFLNNLHPEDQPYLVAFEEKLLRFFRALRIDQIPKFKIQYTFRVSDSKGKYKTILHQMIILEYDDQKNLIRSLGIHSDISHLNIQDKPLLSFIGMDNEPSYYNLNVDGILSAQPDIPFSFRERQIIRLVVEGKKSSEIAELLFISVHTVTTHRRNILNKTKCRNWIELSNIAIQRGWV